jgi:hypothetical protein
MDPRNGVSIRPLCCAMSDTTPKNQDALTAGYKSSPRVTRHGKELRRLEKDGEVLICELLDDSHVGAGFEVVLRKNDELILGHRAFPRALAERAADIFKQDHQRTGWQKSA